jgi:predicted nucleic acid-binding protein
MREPFLVETSVWIDFFNGADTEQVTTLVTYIQEDEPLYLCQTILQEVLQVIANDNQYKKIKEYLMCFNVLNDDSIKSAFGTVEIYRNPRKKGISTQIK